MGTRWRCSTGCRPYVLIAGPEQLLAERGLAQTIDELKVSQPDLETIRLYAAAYEAGELDPPREPVAVRRGQVHRRPRPRRGRRRPPGRPARGAGRRARARPHPRRAAQGRRPRQEGARHPAGAGARVVDAPAIKTDRDKADFAAHEFRRARRKATGEAVHALVEAVGKDVRELAAACQQLIDDTTGVIDEQVVLTYHGGKVEATGFRVADAAMAGDTGEALRLLRHAIAVGVDPVPIVAVLAQQVRQLIKVGAAGRGRSADVARDLGMAPWQVDKARRALGGWTADALAACVHAVAAADFEVKGGGRDPVYAVERCVLTITGQHARNRA